MKPVQKVKNAMRNARWRAIGNLERAKVGQHLSAAYMYALPQTQSGRMGHEALADVTTKVLHALQPVEDLSLDGTHTSAGQAPALAERIAGCVEAGTSYAIRMDGDNALEIVRSLGEELRSCVMISLPVRGRGAEADVVEVTDLLLERGFEPIIRDAEIGDEPFHVLFLRRDILQSGSVGPLGVWLQEAVAKDKAGAVETCDVPVLVPCFNNQTYCAAMIAQLRARGIKDITLLDNASTSPTMIGFLEEAEEVANVIRLGENLGPKKCVLKPAVFDSLPRYFCVTDPDIVFNPFLPNDFIGQLIDLTQEFKIGKAGFALDISHRQFFRELSVDLLFQQWKTWEWEARFWAKPIGTTPSNDKIFKASVDTTFALYDKERWKPHDFIEAIRVAGRFTAVHAPWLLDSDVPTEEQSLYHEGGRFSYYKM